MKTKSQMKIDTRIRCNQTRSACPMTTCHIKMLPTTQKTLPRRKG